MTYSITERVLCASDEIPERGSKGFDLGDTQLFAVRKRGQVYVYENRCPHAGLPLNWQPDQFLDYDRELILCAAHGALFQIENGRCVAGPCPGRSLKSLPCREENGQVILVQASDKQEAAG